MATDFICPGCRQKVKVGRLRAKYTCPNCKTSTVITREDKLLGRKAPRKTFTKRFKENQKTSAN